jgi:hypothetical protein
VCTWGKHFSVKVGYGGDFDAYEVAGGCDEVFAVGDYDEWADCLLHFASAVFAFACAYVAAVFDACEFFVESEFCEDVFDFLGFG